MTEPRQAESSSSRYMRWDDDDWERIKEAAAKHSRDTHLDLSPLDIIRSGTRRFVDQILGAAAEG